MTRTPTQSASGAAIRVVRSTVRIRLHRMCLVATILGATTHASIVAQQPERVVRARTVAEDLQMFSQVLNQIRVNHPDSVDMHALFMAAIEGMIGAVDPHSYVLPAMRLAPEKEKALRDGKLHPVPISFTFIGGAPVVVSVTRTGSAVSLDVLPGDELVSIDGAPVSAMSADELDIVLSGNRGSTVTLAFERERIDGSIVTITRNVRRERAEESTGVPVAFLLGESTGYVRITHFGTERVAAEVREALGDLEKQGMRRLILDLRDNGGGRVDEASGIAGEFLLRGSVVYRSEGRHAEARRTVTVERSFLRGGERPYPVVVLVNRGTASAAELLAGALQDHDRALIVGHPTFGKALIMRGLPLSDGSVVMLVVGHVQTPCGRVIQREYRGITRREYYRMARADRDTVGLPSCRTDNGRVVYGGDGIRPDVVLPDIEPPPLWLARVHEEDLTLRWVADYLQRTPDLPDLELLATWPVLRDAGTADFRAFAARTGLEIPDDPGATARLHGVLVTTLAMARWGNAGFYRMVALLDPAVEAAGTAFDRVESILGRRP